MKMGLKGILKRPKQGLRGRKWDEMDENRIKRTKTGGKMTKMG